MKNNKYDRTMDEMVNMIKDYLEKHPKQVEADMSNSQYKEGYRKALEDFLFIVS